MYKIKQNDVLPALVATLTERNPAFPLDRSKRQPIDLSTAAGVRFKARSRDKKTSFAGVCEITDAAAGKVEYAWQTGNTERVTSYVAEFEIEWPGGLKQTVPNMGYFSFEVIDDLG